MPGLTYLGEIFHVTEEYEDIVDAILTKGSELSHGQRLYFESADFEVQGNAILKRHENLSPDGAYCEQPGWRPPTKYERRGERLGHEVADLVFRRRDGRQD